MAAALLQIAGVGTAIARGERMPTSGADDGRSLVSVGTPERPRSDEYVHPSGAPSDEETPDPVDASDPIAVVPVAAPGPVTVPDDAAAPVAEPAPTPTPAPPPTLSPPTTTAPPPPPQSIEDRFARIVPAAWRAAIPVRFEVISGTTSWAHHDGRIQISASHASGDPTLLDVVIAHEFGHLVAYRYGTGVLAGAAPAGWPAATHNPAEHWADCVQQAWLGVARPSHGLPACGGDQLAWATAFLLAGPPS